MVKGIKPDIKKGDKVICTHDLNNLGIFNDVTIGKTYENVGNTFSFLGSYYLSIINDENKQYDFRCEDFDTVEESRHKKLEDLLNEV